MGGITGTEERMQGRRGGGGDTYRGLGMAFVELTLGKREMRNTGLEKQEKEEETCMMIGVERRQRAIDNRKKTS